MSTVDEAVAAIRAGEPVVLPFDTVYGLAADASSEEPVRRLYALKGREASRPTALVARDVDYVLECVPELGGRAEAIARELLPGPFTLVVPNPAHRYPWLAGSNPETLGIRVPDLAGPTKDVLQHVGAVIATSANHPGGADPKRLDEVPENIRAGAGAVIDGGDLLGTPSTVVDITGDEARVLRESAVQTSDVLARIKSSRRA